MAVDYISAINQNGSGLNITQIVESLVEAETKPKKDNINEKIDGKNLEYNANLPDHFLKFLKSTNLNYLSI